jgi:hypothetical protein
MTPEMKISIILGILSFTAAVLTPIILARTKSQKRNDDSLTLKNNTETLEKVMNQNAKLIEQNMAIIARLNGTGRMIVDFDMEKLIETGRTKINFGTIEILAVPSESSPA